MVRGLDHCGCGRSSVGICLKQTWNLLVDRYFQPGSDAMAGFFRANADPSRTIPVGPKEMGLLDRVADREYRQYHLVHQCGTGLHAYRQRPVPGQWPLVTLDLVQSL